METFLKKKTGKVPNWAWVLLIGGALGVGLYLRHRNSSSEEVEEELGVEEAPEGSLASYNGTEAAGGLAGAGLVGPAGGGLTPVETPFIPEGVQTVIAEENATIRELAGYIQEHPSVERETITVPAEREITGGGAPAATAPRTPAKNDAQKKAKEQTQDEINRLNNEIQSLNGEIGQLSSQIDNLTTQIKSAKQAKHPNQSQINQWESQRSQAQNKITGDRTSVAAKQAKVTALKAKL